MFKAIGQAFNFLINAIAEIIIGIPEALGIDEWYIFYIALGLISCIIAWIRKKCR